MAPSTQGFIENGNRDKSTTATTTNSNNNHNSNVKCISYHSFGKHQKKTIRGEVAELMSIPNKEKEIISLGIGDASAFPCFRKGQEICTTIVAAATSGQFDGYAPSCGYPFARRAVAEYLTWSGGKLGFREENVFLTSGATQAIEITLKVLARENCNILIPRPGFPLYEAMCDFNGIEVRHYNLLPTRNWEINLSHVKDLADSNTVAFVVINPNNPTGAVYSRAHLSQIAETARQLNLPVLSDEIYAHMVFEGSEFVSMSTFALNVPIITIGGLSKRWMIPGWRLGWVALSNPHGVTMQIKEAIMMLMNVIAGPASIIQASVPGLLSDSNKGFHDNILKLLETSAYIAYARIKKTEALNCYAKSQGSMFMMVEVNTTLLSDIKDDSDFARKLMKEESVLVLPGSIIGLKNWIRIFVGVPAELMEAAFDRIHCFCQRRKIAG